MSVLKTTIYGESKFKAPLKLPSFKHLFFKVFNGIQLEFFGKPTEKLLKQGESMRFLVFAVAIVSLNAFAQGSQTGGAHSGGSGAGSESLVDGSTSGVQSGSQGVSGSGINNATGGGGNGAPGPVNNVSIDASIVCNETNNSNEIRPGDLCYSECRPKRAVLGLVGRVQIGLDRKSCLPCLQRYPDRFHLKDEYRGEGPSVQIHSEARATIGPGDLCYSECKPRRSFLGIVGARQQGLDRASCSSCLQQNPGKFRILSPQDDGVTCQLSADQQVATCLGKTYRLDSSVSESGREIIEEASRPAQLTPTSGTRVEGQ